MRHAPFMPVLALAFAMLLALQSFAGAAASFDAPVPTKSAARSVWLVEFDEPPLASFRGEALSALPKSHGLAATSPAVTGDSKLDVGSAASLAYRSALGQLRERRLMAAARQLGRALDPLFVYEVVNNGVALELDAAEAGQLARMDGIARVAPEFVHRPMTDAGPGWIRAGSLWNAPGGGFRGEGRVIGVIDTGILASHRSFRNNSDGYLIQNPRGRYLGRCASNANAGCNSKLIGIHDFTTGEGDKEPNDGLDLDGHGTHVASIAAGNPSNLSIGGNSYSVSGVAPRANLISYKACEKEAKCRGAWTVAALNQAVADQVDVINYSIGGDARDPWTSSDGLAMLAAREAGVVVVVSAGNDGGAAGSLSSPANAPWVLAVANTTHDRANVAALTLSGGNEPRPGGGVLYGASLTTRAYGPAPLVHAGDYGSALCATGPNVDALPPDPRTSPWSGMPFSGQVVICERGTYARVIKGFNVRNAGGGAMVLLNAVTDGASLVADPHELPATHLGYADGLALKQWLASGTGHKAQVSASTVMRVAGFADILASSSGRGPVSGDWLKPNLAAPGSNILGADRLGTDSWQYLSGTSMAAPHVAGAVALLKQAHPGWGPAEIESALQTTARASVRLPDDVTSAGVFDAGAGVIDLSRAVQAGLVFPVSGAQFRQANPAQGGSPRELNQAALIDGQCLRSCRFTRSVRAGSGSGQWRVTSAVAGGELQVTPSSFSLNAGQSQTLQIEYRATDDTRYGRWQEGTVSLARVGGGSAEIVIPVALRVLAGNLPDVIPLKGASGIVPSEAGWAEIELSGLVALPSARFAGSDLVEPLQVTATVMQDDTEDEIYDGLGPGSEGSRIFRLRAPASGPMRLRVEAESATARDIDLFVGRAGTAADLPSQASELCRSRSPQASERCDLIVDAVAGDHFWILLQNWKASSVGSDAVTLRAALVPLTASTRPPAQRPLVVTGPGHVDQDARFKVRVAWDDPGMTPGATRWGHVLIGANESNPGGVGGILVKFTRSGTVTHAARALQPGVSQSLRLLPGQAQERLYVEVPPNASRLRVTSQGQGNVKIYLARDGSPSTPGIAMAPSRSAAAASSTQPGANDSVSLGRPALQPGRWYVTPANIGNEMADFSLTAEIELVSDRPQPHWGAWYNPQRPGSGVFFSPYLDGHIWTFTWYTYREDGSPTWYGGTVLAPEPRQGSVSFDLYRYSWDGNRTHAVIVGSMILSLVDAQTLWMSWNLDGESGSQQLRHIDAQGCAILPGARDRPDGSWHTPSRSGFGYNTLIYPGMETYVGYLYDGLGEARWIGAYREQDVTRLERVEMIAELRKGACPLCSYRSTTAEPVGLFWRSFSSGTRGHMGMELEFPPPLIGSWRTDLNVQLLTSPVSCP